MTDESSTPIDAFSLSAPIPPGGMQSGVAAIRSALSSMPASPGVYRMLGADGSALYVGKARQLKNRVASYAQIAQLPLRLQRMVAATVRLEYTLTASEAEALLLETNLIKSLKPRYNILLKDDKSYPYIHLDTSHPYPRIAKYRGTRNAPGKYFGPFASAGAVNETVTLLQKAFLLRPCSDNVFKNRTRPCLQYQIRRCSAPCVRAIDEAGYAALLAQAEAFLSGKNREIQEQLAREMEAASDALDFEHAATLRDRIRALTYVQQKSRLDVGGLGDADILALAREGQDVCVQVFAYRGGGNYGGRAWFPAQIGDRDDAEVMAMFIGQYYQRQTPPKRVLVSHAPQEEEVLAEALALLAGHKVEIHSPQRGTAREAVMQASRNASEALARHRLESMQNMMLLEGVAALFSLPAPPSRIEVYDNSHVSGTHAVGAMIAAGPEGFLKKTYRLFTIRSESLTPGDDYGMLREVLTRRFRRLLEAEDGAEGAGDPQRPDLVLIDGGAGQLSAAMEAFAELGIADIPLAAISKGPDRNAGREWFHLPGREAFQLPPADPTLHYLQRLRDEAHRFAIGAHRAKRSKAIRTSELDAVPAIGPARKKALLRHFGSAKAAAAASVQELAQVSGISRELAEKIHAHFHQ